MKTRRFLISLLLTLSLLLPLLCACGPQLPASTTGSTATGGATTAAVTTAPAVTTDPAVTTAPEEQTTLDPGVEYEIWYNLGGGIDPMNPEVYTSLDELDLAIPLRPGYRFLGWEGTGLSEVTRHVTIPKGSYGEREYTAVWQELSEEESKIEWIDPTHFGKDDGVEPFSAMKIPSNTRLVGYREEALYTAKTVYTEIVTDGVLDPAYTYGVCWQSGISASGTHTQTGSYFNSYIVRGQEGRAHVFIEVYDDDIVINDDLWRAHYYRCDSIHVYYEYENGGVGHSMWTFAAEPNRKYTKQHPDDWKVVMTDYGYNVEFSFDNNGSPFFDGDQLGIAIYLNDCFDYVNLDSYTKDTIKAPSRHNPLGTSYQGPNASNADGILFSIDSATKNPEIDLGGGVDVETVTGDMLLDMIRGNATVGVIVGADASPHTRKLASELHMQLLLYGVEANRLRDVDDMESDYEILVGVTNRAGTARLLEDYPYNDYGFAIYDNQIAILGVTEENLTYACELLSALFVYAEEGGESRFAGGAYFASRMIMEGSEAVPKLEGLDLITDAGDNSYHLLKNGVEESEFLAYCQALVDAGFSLYATNTLGSLSCVTYHTKKVVVNVSWDAANGNDLRVVVDHRRNTDLPPLEVEAYTPTHESTVTLLKPNNLTQILRLDNGEFIVIDSGTNGQHLPLYEELVKQSDDGKPVVAAWIFTHFHQDHNGGFVELVQRESYMKDITIKALIYNNPAQQIIDLASAKDRENMAMWNDLVRSTGATVYQARTGQTYRFANAEIDILFTYEDLMPFYVTYDRSNPTSLIFSVKIAGQRIIFTGDASAEGMRVCIARYGEELKADFVQLSHHGQGDGGSPVEFYQLIDADYVFNPGSGSCASAERWASENAKKVFIRDAGTVTLTLPYQE